MTATSSTSRVDLHQLIQKLGGDPDTIRNSMDLGQLWEAQRSSDHGVVKRLLAAFSSASTRGGVTFQAERLRMEFEEDYHMTSSTVATVRVTVTSSGGRWSYRAYRMVGVLRVTEDGFGVHGWYPLSGAAVVTSRKRDTEDRTLFGGLALGQMIGSLYFGRGCARNEMSDLCSEPAGTVPAHPA